MKVRLKAKTEDAEIVLRKLSSKKLKGMGKTRFVSEDPLILEISSRMWGFIPKALALHPTMKENIKNTFKGIIESEDGKFEEFEVI